MLAAPNAPRDQPPYTYQSYANQELSTLQAQLRATSIQRVNDCSLSPPLYTHLPHRQTIARLVSLPLSRGHTIFPPHASILMCENIYHDSPLLHRQFHSTSQKLAGAKAPSELCDFGLGYNLVR